MSKIDEFEKARERAARTIPEAPLLNQDRYVGYVIGANWAREYYRPQVELLEKNEGRIKEIVDEDLMSKVEAAEAALKIALKTIETLESISKRHS